MQKSYEANAPPHDRQTKLKEGQQITAPTRNGLIFLASRLFFTNKTLS